MMFLEIYFVDGMALLAEEVVDLCLDQDEFLQAARSSKFQHRVLSSLNRLV